MYLLTLYPFIPHMYWRSFILLYNYTQEEEAEDDSDSGG